MYKFILFTAALFSTTSFAQERTPAMDDYQSRTVVTESVNPIDKPAFHWEAAYVGEVGRNFSGGAFVGSTYSGLATVRASYDLEKAAGLNGLTLFSHFQGTHGAHPTDYVGDAQATSNIQARVDTAKLYELWIQKESQSKQASLLLGLLDVNAEFYTTSASGTFLNSSFGIGAEVSQTSGPSIYPTPGLAVRAKIHTEDSFYLQTAVFESTPGDASRLYGTQIRYIPDEGHFLISEAGYALDENKYSVGGWTYNSPGVTGNAGIYILLQQSLNESTTAFLRYGTAASAVNRFDQNISSGITFKGVLSSRKDDVFGLAVTSARVGSHHSDTQVRAGTPVDKEETTVELTYVVQLAEDISVQPDFQYVSNPNVDPTRENALVGAVRFRIGFEN